MKSVLCAAVAAVAAASPGGPFIAGNPRVAVEGCADVRAEDGVVTVTSTGAVSFARLTWPRPLPSETRVLNDAWERSYGDLAWRDLSAKRYSPWYFLAQAAEGRTYGVGVETGPGAMCCWEVTTNGVTLVLDLRAGGRPVRLGGRTLAACRLVTAVSRPDETPWTFGRRFCRMMCPSPRLPKEPVYGYNDWYCAYGRNTATNFLADAAYVMSCAKDLANAPYMVMDDGWQKNSPAVVKGSGHGPWDAAGPRFGMAMPDFCRAISALGAKPGLWYRPLRAWDGLPADQRLLKDARYLDPTVPAVRARIVADMVRFREWGCRLVKIDYLAYDLSQIWPCGRLRHPDRYIQDDRAWRDSSRTTAEVMLDLYRAMKDAVGDDVVIIGCNAFNHLAAGVFELQRTGDDTSGRVWRMTKNNGVNTLAMRSIQDGAFFKIDADCVGLASEGAVPWTLNRQWMDLLGRSGTPFFVSWRRALAGAEVRAALAAAFRAAAEERPVAEPLDWMRTPRPVTWRIDGGTVAYDWENATPSLLPPGREYRLVWSDEFDGKELDASKWGFRTNFWGRRATWFATAQDGAVVIKDGKAHLRIVRLPDGRIVTPQLQTGELLWDSVDRGKKGLWPFPKRTPAKFLHRYGYYECRCRLQRRPGWWSAFWMQSPSQGATLDAAASGIEHDIMESFEPGKVIPAWFHRNGVGADYKGFCTPRRGGLSAREANGKNALDVDTDTFHTYGLLWEPDGYTLYFDGKQRGEKVGRGPGEAVSACPQFILLSAEAKGCRADDGTGTAVPEAAEAARLGDEFVVDYVRVYDVAATPRPRPGPAMAARMAAEEDIIGIVHWGLNTYTDREWGYGDEDPALLAPSAFDADQIVGACKAGGLKGLVIVAKHHDGFCLWPTKTTRHNITKSPFRGGKGDYVREMERACRRAGLKFGVYVSPWDRNSAHYATEKYVDIYHAQIRELLGGAYGEVFEMWFDGANGGDGYYGGARERRRIGAGYYRFDEIFRFVRALQPNVTIFGGSDTADLRWPGNERGLLDPDSRATVDPSGGFVNGRYLNPRYPEIRNKGLATGRAFMVCEADFPLRKGWFHHDRERGSVKSAARLMRLYLSSVGNGGVMNIGVALDRRGLLAPEDVEALSGFTALREGMFRKEVRAGEPFNVIVMREDLSKGEQVDAWAFTADGRTLFSGRSIGNKRIRVLPRMCAAKTCRLDVLRHGGDLQNVSFRLYQADPELVKTVLSAAEAGGETDTAKWMTAPGD